MITKPGFYSAIPEAEYHGDPCPAPSLSSSVAKILLQQTAGHAWWAHPRLNRSKALEVEEATKAQHAGTVLHRLLLGQGRPLKVLNFENYRTNAAKAARDEALAEGAVPVLAHAMAEAEEVAAGAKLQIGRTDTADVLADGEAEVTGVWQEDNGVWCRMRIDWLPDSAREGGHIIVPDFKTTGKSAHPDKWQKDLFDYGGDIQAAFYERGLRKLVPKIRTVDFRFIVIEQTPPYAVSVCRVSNEALEQARDTVDLAIRTWGELLKRGTSLEHWPFYDTETVSIDPPLWRAAGNELLRMRMGDRIRQWQAPLSTDMTKAA